MAWRGAAWRGAARRGVFAGSPRLDHLSGPLLHLVSPLDLPLRFRSTCFKESREWPTVQSPSFTELRSQLAVVTGIARLIASRLDLRWNRIPIRGRDLF